MKELWLGTGAFLLAVCPIGAADKDKEGKVEKLAAKLVGTWTYVSAEWNGQKTDKEDLKDDKVTITRKTITLQSSSGTFVLNYTLDLKKTPVVVSMAMADNPKANAKGIVEVKGDDLKICYARSGEAPKKFAARKGSGHRLMVLKRVAQNKGDK
jgi:uncharacterized protein (TIGR03067 family)